MTHPLGTPPRRRRLRYWLPSALLLAFACRIEQVGPNADITQILISPDSISVDAGQSVQFQAVGQTAGGSSRPVSVTWSATGGTIDANGVYTADATPGTFTVTATLDHPSLSSSSRVKNRGALKQIILSPATGSVAAGGHFKFSAYGKMANGDSVAVTATYTASGGTIDASGMYTAGPTPGTYPIIASITTTTQGGGTRADTSQVTITGGTVPVGSVVVSPATGSVEAGKTIQITATTKDANGNVLTGRAITWSSSNTAVATVSTGGLVTGKAVGSATITAASEGKSGTAAITVTGSSGSSVVFVGAGDISDCGNNGDEETAKLLDGIAGTVYTLGDNVYSSGTATEFAQCYDPTWGRHKARTKPAPGNHDYGTAGAAGYFGYFGALAGPSGRGYYSYNLGDWHIISLNSEVSMSAGSAQEIWLRGDLAANTKQCTLAYWHKPRFSSGTHHGSTSAAQPLWQALYEFGAEIVLGGHEHSYERFAPQTPTGAADPTRGIREFVAGTGGASHYTGNTRIANSEVFNGATFGVLKLTLGPGTYSWQFVHVAGQTFTDTGSGTCH